jgi:hypothetical protein
MERSELLANSALNEVRALRREVQGLRDLRADLDRRVAALEGVKDTVTDAVKDGVTVKDAVTDRTDPNRPYPRKVPGTTGRGTKYTLSDDSVVPGPRAKAVEAEAALSVPQDVANLAQ